MFLFANEKVHWVHEQVQSTFFTKIAVSQNNIIRNIYIAHFVYVCLWDLVLVTNTGSSKKMDGIWNRYNLKRTGRIYTFSTLKCSEKFKVLDVA